MLMWSIQGVTPGKRLSKPNTIVLLPHQIVDPPMDYGVCYYTSHLSDRNSVSPITGSKNNGQRSRGENLDIHDGQTTMPPSCLLIALGALIYEYKHFHNIPAAYSGGALYSLVGVSDS